MDNEFELLIGAIMRMEGRIRATEVSQQLMAAHLADLEPEIAKNMADTMGSISESDQIETEPKVRDFLALMAKHLRGDHEAELLGLLKPAPEQEPIPWLRGVIDGGKNSSSDN